MRARPHNACFAAAPDGSARKELRTQTGHYRRLLELGADEIDLAAVPPARRRQLVAAGMHMTAQAISRLEPARRHPLLLAVLSELAVQRGDELLAV